MTDENKTPRWIDTLIDDLAPPELAEEIRGDLYELFVKDNADYGSRHARRRYAFNALGFLAKSFFWRRTTSPSNNPLNMLYNYFKMARRSLMAYKSTTAINITGLVVGIASALVIFTVIRYELSFNKMHSDLERLYRLVRVSGEDMSEFRTGVSYPVPRALKEEVPAIEAITSVEYFGGAYVDVIDSTGNSEAMFREDIGCVMVEPNFFDVFDFHGTGMKWIEGNPAKALNEQFNVVLTESMAKKYFGNRSAVGKSIRFEKFYDAKITGVVSDFPANVDFPFTILIAYSTLEKVGANFNNWYGVNDSHQTFLKIAKNQSKDDVEKQIAKVHTSHTTKDLQHRHYLLQEITEMHHEAKFGNYGGRTISRETILALGLIAVFLLATACINYINLSTAQSTMRSKEIGLRKVLGSHRTHLISQLIVETFVIVLIAGVLALIVSELLIINLQTLLNLHLERFNFTEPLNLLTLLAIVIVLTVLSGLYPSVVMSRFSPVQSLKSKFATTGISGVSLRKVLVIAQFTMTQMLVVGTFIVVSQMRYFQNVDMGFNKESIVTLNVPATSTHVTVESMAGQLKRLAVVKDVAISSTLPSGVKRGRSSQDVGRVDAVASSDYIIYEYQAIDPSYFNVYEIKLVAGRNLLPADSTGKAVLLNRTVVKHLRLGTPDQAIGQEVKFPGDRRATVVGVVEDFYSNSMKEHVDNTVFFCNPRAAGYVSIKLDLSNGSASMQDAVKEIQKVWSQTYPNHIFSYQFFDDNIKAFYVQEEKYARLFQLFSAIFLVIGCLGLYGLITFVLNRKGKEVAIRKVLGATLSNILVMFSREYVWLILISFALAVPVAYYAVNSWLSNFANRVELSWWLFILPGLSVLAIALLVVVSKSFRAANTNPVDKLKYE